MADVIMIEQGDSRHILNWPEGVLSLIFRNLCVADLVSATHVCTFFAQKASPQIAMTFFAELSKHYYIPEYFKRHPVILANLTKLPDLINLLNKPCTNLIPIINQAVKPEWVFAALLGDENAVITLSSEFGMDGAYDFRVVNECHFYAMGGHWGPLQRLLDRFEPPFQVAEADPLQSVAICAARSGQWQFLLNLAEFYDYDLNHFDQKNNRTLLHQAIWNGHLDLLQKLIARGVPVHLGENLLLWAAKYGQWGIYDYLSGQNLALERPANFGECLAIYTAQNGSLERFLQVVQEYALADRLPRMVVDGNNVFTAAAVGNNFAVIEYLVANEIFDINSCVKGRYHILHRAATNGHGELCQQLSQRFQLNVDITDDEGNNILHHAVMGENWHCCHFIATTLHKDKKWQTNNKGENIVHLAAQTGIFWLVRILLNTFGTEHLRDKTQDGNTVLHYAVLTKNMQLIDLLIIHYGMDINAQNNQGETPIHHFLKTNEKSEENTQFVHDLIYEYGADLTVQDKNRNRITMLL